VLAVISDTHLPRGTRHLSRECLDVLSRAELILHAGDVTAAHVLDELRELAPVQAVYGNMDEPQLRASLPERHVAEIAGVRIGMIHIPGPRHGRAERLLAMFPGCDAVVYGHTHVPELTLHEGRWILNPGSPTERRSAPTRSLIALETAGGVLRPELVVLP
jgi:putative phosphoesterase